MPNDKLVTASNFQENLNYFELFIFGMIREFLIFILEIRPV